MSHSDGFPPVAGFVSQAQLVFGSRVIQTDEGTGRLTEVPGNHQGAHGSTGGSAGQLGGRGDKRQKVSLKKKKKSFTNNIQSNLCCHLETPLEKHH